MAIFLSHVRRFMELQSSYIELLYRNGNNSILGFHVNALNMLHCNMNSCRSGVLKPGYGIEISGLYEQLNVSSTVVIFFDSDVTKFEKKVQGYQMKYLFKYSNSNICGRLLFRQ